MPVLKKSLFFDMRKFLFTLLLFIYYLQVFAQVPTVGLVLHEEGSLDDGYVMFSPALGYDTYLIDKCGREIHSWSGNYRQGVNSVYLLDDGSILRGGNSNNSVFNFPGKGGAFEMIDWEGNIKWRYTYSNAKECQHHDFIVLPNGHVLLIAWEKKLIGEAVAAGRNPDLVGTEVWSEGIIEIKPLGSDSAEIVWEWHLWDHLVQDYDSTKQNYKNVFEHPELVDLNYNAAFFNDWIHLNSIDYNEELDQIMVSAHNFNEIWVIDHSTTSAEAAMHSGGKHGKGGDLLYRWGNPAAYRHGDESDQKLFWQHHAHWIPKGLPNEDKIMIFNNGNLRTPIEYSSVEIIELPIDAQGFYNTTLPFLPTEVWWTYNDSIPQRFYAKNTSGAQQLSNGNILITNGFAGTFFEIDTLKKTVWKYVNPLGAITYPQGSTNLVLNNLFRSTFYSSSHPAFVGRMLLPGNPLELNPYPSTCSITTNLPDAVQLEPALVFPNPSNAYIHVQLPSSVQRYIMFNNLGNEVMSGDITAPNFTLHVANLPNGLYRVYFIGNEINRYTNIMVIH